MYDSGDVVVVVWCWRAQDGADLGRRRNSHVLLRLGKMGVVLPLCDAWIAVCRSPTTALGSQGGDPTMVGVERPPS